MPNISTETKTVRAEIWAPAFHRISVRVAFSIVWVLIFTWLAGDCGGEVSLREVPRGKPRYLSLDMDGTLVQRRLDPTGEPFPIPFELAVLRQEAVQEELTIDARGRTQIDELGKEWDSWRKMALSELTQKDATEEDVRRHVRRYHGFEEKAANLSKTVVPTNRAPRFRQILFRVKLRYDGPLSSLARGPLAAEFGLTGLQRTALRATARAAAEEQAAKSAEVQKQAYETILECLTEAQRKKYHRMMGTLAFGGAPHLEVLAMQLQKKSPLALSNNDDPLLGLRVYVTYEVNRFGGLTPSMHVRKSARGRLILSALRNEEMREQIALVADQIAELQHIAREVREFDRRITTLLTDARSRGDAAVSAARQQAGKLGKRFWQQTDRAISDVLLPHQFEALSAAAEVRDVIQRGPVLAFQTPGLQKKLGITPAQARRITTAADRLAKQIADQAAVLEQEALTKLAEALPANHKAEFLRQLGSPTRHCVAPITSIMADMVFDSGETRLFLPRRRRAPPMR